MEKVKKLALKGSPFQILLMASFLYRTWAFMNKGSSPIVSFIDITGMCLFSYCLWILYIKKGSRQNIITTGLFKYTRHPMYTGLVFIDLRFWFTNNLSPLFWISVLVFYASIIMAGYYQEKETLARFGSEAERYYSQTPRLFILYPFVKKARK